MIALDTVTKEFGNITAVDHVSGLDPIGIRQVRKILEDLRNCGMTVILNSHLLSEVEKTCDTAAIIHNWCAWDLSPMGVSNY